MGITHAVTDPAQLKQLELTGALAKAAHALPGSVRRRLRPLADARTGAGVCLSALRGRAHT